MRSRTAAALALAGSLAVAVQLAAQPPAPQPPGGQPPATPAKDQAKEPGKDMPKDSGPKPKEFEWPKEIDGKDLPAWVKDAADPDPAIREAALQTIPNFGPPARKGPASKAILTRMDGAKEKDPGVRIAAYATAATLGFEDDLDTKEAIRLLIAGVEGGVSGGLTRLHGVQALGAFGAKAESALKAVVSQPVLTDASYETRRCVANTIGKIGISEASGPSATALNVLSTTLLTDPSVAVRMEAAMAMVFLGPPWQPRPAGSKGAPQVDEKAAAAYVANVKKRLAPAPPKAGEKAGVGLIEKDKQVEIWCRLTLMRFDPKEVNDANLTGIARHIFSGERGPRLQALQALGIIGEAAGPKVDDVVRALLSLDDPAVVVTAINALTAMGAGAKPALPELEKLNKGTKDEALKMLTANAIKIIAAAKPGGPPPVNPDPKDPKAGPEPKKM